MPGGFCPHLRPARRPRRLDGRGRRIRRRLGAGREARSSDRACCRAPERRASPACLATCRAAPPTTCSGSAAISSATEATLRLVRCLAARSVDPDAPDARRTSGARPADGRAGRLGRGRCHDAEGRRRRGRRARLARFATTTARRCRWPVRRAHRRLGHPRAADHQDLGA